MKVQTLTKMAVLAALSIVLAALIHFPIFPTAAFLEYDPADIPIFIGTFMFGPTLGLVLTAITCIIQGLTVSAGSGVYGIIMHFIATGSFVLVAGNIYNKFHSQKGAIVALIAGTITMAIVMVPANLIFTPMFMGAPVEAVWAMVLPIIIPFNLIKAGINSVITFFIYKPISKIFKTKKKTVKNN